MRPRLLFPPRLCPVCLDSEPRLLFRQVFSTFDEGGLLDGYDVVKCSLCGAAYADRIPSQSTFDAYYAEMSKYEQSHRDGRISALESEKFRQVFDLVSPHVRQQESVVDVGCATGGLLAEFKRRGYERLLGFDPSPTCAEVARRLYDIEVRPMAIGAMAQVAERFDVVSLTGVLEHLCDVDAAVQFLKQLMKPGGRLYLEVPDASRFYQWFSAPFQFFSMEHLNFFSPRSLTNLLMRHGFECGFASRVTRWLGPRAAEPAIAALFTVSGRVTAPVYDDETEPALEKYLTNSRLLDVRICAAIARLVESRVPLAVWGAGTHTLRLLEASSLAQADLVAYIDSNPRYQGKHLRGVPILSPHQFARPDAVILISSHVVEREIKEQIQSQLGWPNGIVCLYEDAPTDALQPDSL